ncbi:hypothetical protein TrVE_jg5909 [Triparma verrucosa]|uniref:Uncharacterized protein n=1 Tax=Triparma verrucosa TaxID=1606542 RepID=A0A9W7C5S5_9STRA|nr:hypothetical protein TrVE_jg5909 [Triparma verrucosa]
MPTLTPLNPLCHCPLALMLLIVSTLLSLTNSSLPPSASILQLTSTPPPPTSSSNGKPPAFCTYTKLQLSYTIPKTTESPSLPQTFTLTTSDQGKVLNVTSHPSSSHSLILPSAPPKTPTLQCYAEGDPCTVSINSLELFESTSSPPSDYTHTLHVKFSTVPSAVSNILDYLDFYPLEKDYERYVGEPEWDVDDGSVLRVPVTGLVVEDAAGGVLRIDMKPQPEETIFYELKGEVSFMMESSGVYTLAHALDSSDDSTYTFEVNHCWDYKSIDYHISSSSFESASKEEKVNRLLYYNEGRISMSGSKPFTLPSSLFATNEYTITFHLTLTSNLESEFGTLWFKGSGHTNDRTPACFLKREGGLIFQASSEEDPEMQVETDYTFETYKTYYVAVTVNNHQYITYVNGEVVGRIENDKTGLKHNTENFNFGWAEGLPGVQMDVVEVRVLEGFKSFKDVGREWEKVKNKIGDDNECKALVESSSVSTYVNRGDEYSVQMIHRILGEVKELSDDEECTEPGKRLRLYEDLADLGNDYGALKAGEMHLYGVEFDDLGKKANSEFCEVLDASQRSESKGVNYLRIASDLNNGEAMYRLSILVNSGIGISGLLSLPPTSVLPQSSSEGGTIMKPPLSTELMDQNNLNDLSLDLLHRSTRTGNKNAALSLAHKYQKGYAGLPPNQEAALHYAKIASDAADVYYHTPGNQPYHEMHRLRVGHEIELLKGEQGEDDEELQYVIMMSEQGDVDAMNSYASMLYWGARGFDRDHVKALELWNKVAEHDHIGGLCGAASMYVRGEGTEVDMTKAVEYYERAAAKDVPTALNGLGYAYFYGQGGMEVDQVKAFEYFSKAASLEQDSDSLTNAAHCYATGQGVEEDQFKAATLYDKAATKFGNFDSALEMGRRFATGGRGTDRNPTVATNYLMSASRVGESGELVRKGFDLFMRGEHDAALKVYAEAAELGYEVGANNAAYLLDVGVASISAEADEVIGGDTSNSIVLYDGEGYDKDKDKANKLLNKAASLRFHWMAAEDGNAESFAAIGDSYYWGVGADQDQDKAFWWYSKSASAGSIKGSYYVAFMHEFHTEDLDRALSQYAKVLKLVEGGEEGLEMIFLVKFSMWRCEMKKGKGWQLVKRLKSGFWWTGGEGPAPLPQLPIVKQLTEDEEEEEEVMEGDFSSRMIGVVAKVRYVARDLFYEHRGKVFGLNQSEDLGYDVKWGSVVMCGLLALLCVNLFRIALAFFY